MEEGKEGQMVMEGDLTWDGEYTTLCTDDVLWDRASETCVILLTSVTPIHSIQRKKKPESQILFPHKVRLCVSLPSPPSLLSLSDTHAHEHTL